MKFCFILTIFASLIFNFTFAFLVPEDGLEKVMASANNSLNVVELSQDEVENLIEKVSSLDLGFINNFLLTHNVDINFYIVMKQDSNRDTMFYSSWKSKGKKHRNNLIWGFIDTSLCFPDYKKIVFLLNLGANVNTLDFQGQTPIFEIAKFAYSDVTMNVFKLLINRGADVNIQDINGNTPLHELAIENFDKYRNVEIL